MTNARKRILVVDDEPLVVKSLEGLLSLEGDYEILGFTSCRAALEAIRTRPCDVAISDYLMPEMDGVSFLKEVRRLYVEVPLIILTGYADKDSAVRAINEIGLYHYLEKPWNNDDLLAGHRWRAEPAAADPSAAGVRPRAGGAGPAAHPPAVRAPRLKRAESSSSGRCSLRFQRVSVAEAPGSRKTCR